MNIPVLTNNYDEKILKILELMEEKMYDCRHTGKLEELRKKRLLWRDHEHYNINDNDLIDINHLQLLLHKDIDVIRFDINHDGYISKHEFNTMIQSLCNENNLWALEYNISEEWSKQYIKNIINKALECDNCCNTQEQHLLIAYGPPGSGKSSTTNTYLDNHTEIGYININIDDIVKDYMKHILHSEQFFNDQEVYFKVRNGWPTYTKNKILKICFENSYNFRIETTGNSLLTLDSIVTPASKQNYRIKILYTLVPFIELVYRLIKREHATGQGHPDFRKLLNMCKDGSHHIIKYKQQFTIRDTILFINNNEIESKIICTHKELQECLDTYDFNTIIKQNLSNHTIMWT
tara:strand:+ start:128 stop:1174 length:1047 start_codon:yes stop_codon:yes gene_type:complete